jgi:hypothetical protein
MNYHLLRLPSDPLIIGVNNGICQVELDDKKYIDKQAYEQMREYFSGINWWEKECFPNFPIHFHAQVLKGARLTDFLSFSPFFIGCPFLINNEVAKVFGKLKIQEYRLFPATLYDNDKIISKEYQLFYTRLLEFEIVNFEKSIFFHGSPLTGKRRYGKVTNLEEYKAFSKQGNTNLERMVMSEKFDRSLDFFCGRLGGIYASESMKDAIEILGFTGIRILEARNPEIILYE